MWQFQFLYISVLIFSAHTYSDVLLYQKQHRPVVLAVGQIMKLVITKLHPFHIIS